MHHDVADFRHSQARMSPTEHAVSVTKSADVVTLKQVRCCCNPAPRHNVGRLAFTCVGTYDAVHHPTNAAFWGLVVLEMLADTQ